MFADPLRAIVKNLALSPRGATEANENSRNSVCELRLTRVGRWHTNILNFLNICIKSVNDGEWRCAVAASMGKQLDIYGDAPEEKAFFIIHACKLKAG